MKKTLIWVSIVGVIGLAGCSGSEQSESKVSSSASSAAPAAKESSQPAEASSVATPAQQTAAQKSTADGKQEVAAVQTPASTGESLYATCVGCHGASGEGGVGPKLRGQSEAAIEEKLKAYRAGKQRGPMTSMMAPNVQSFSDEDIQKVAKYITTL